MTTETNTSTETNETPKSNLPKVILAILIILSILWIDNRTTHFVSGTTTATTDSTKVETPKVDTIKPIATTTIVAVDTTKKVVAVATKDTTKKK